MKLRKKSAAGPSGAAASSSPATPGGGGRGKGSKTTMPATVKGSGGKRTGKKRGASEAFSGDDDNDGELDGLSGDTPSKTNVKPEDVEEMDKKIKRETKELAAA
jgi:hypothetical protein